MTKAFSLGFMCRDWLDSTTRAIQTFDACLATERVSGHGNQEQVFAALAAWHLACATEATELAATCRTAAKSYKRYEPLLIRAADDFDKMAVRLAAMWGAEGSPAGTPVGLGDAPLVDVLRPQWWQASWQLAKSIALLVGVGFGIYVVNEKLLVSAAEQAQRDYAAMRMTDAMVQQDLANCTTVECREMAMARRKAAMPSDCGWLETPLGSITGSALGLGAGFSMLWWVWRHLGASS